MRYLENSIKENLKEATLHRKMARDGKKQDLGLINEETI